MDALKRHKISRTALRNHCKKLEGDIAALLQEFPADGLVKLRALKCAYEGQKAKCDVATGEISQLIANEEDLLADLEDCTRLDEIFYDTISKINEKLNSVAAADVKPVVVPSQNPPP